MLNILGWIGSILFAICGLPQAIKCYKEKHADGISTSFLLMWLFGEIFTMIYVLPKMDLPLLFNYSINLVFLFVITYFKFRKKWHIEL